MIIRVAILMALLVGSIFFAKDRLDLEARPIKTIENANGGDREGLIAKGLQMLFEQVHFAPKDLDDGFSSEAFRLYLEQLDNRKRMFTADEVNKFGAYKLELDDNLQSGAFPILDLTEELYGKAVERAKKYTTEILDGDFTFDQKEVLELDTDKIDFPIDEADLKNRWAKIIKYDVLNRLLDKEEDENNKKTYEENLANSIDAVKKNYKRVYEFWEERRRSDFFEFLMTSFAMTNDPHSVYFSPKAKDDYDISISGRYAGIGARLSKEGDYTVVSSVMPGGPAWKGKELEAKDKIIAIAQEGEDPVDIVGWRTDDAVLLIRGKAKTKVTLRVRKLDNSIKDIVIMRDEVEIEESFVKSFVIDLEDKAEKIGLIQLPKFYVDFKDGKRNCSDDVKKELKKLKKENINGLIFDLRNNPGGSLSDVVDMAGFFIEEGPIVQVKARNRKKRVWEDEDSKVYYDGPMIVLVNEFSASAAEIFAAALQDYGRALIVGSPSTFGKGSVQRFFDLDRLYRGGDDVKPLGNVKMTIQKYYRINGGSVQLRGVVPDIILPDRYTYMDIGEKEYDNALGFTEIDPLSYDQNVLKVDGIAALAEKSKTRVQNSAGFQLIDEAAKTFKELQDNTSYSVNMEDLKADRQYRKEQGEKFDKLDKAIAGMSSYNLVADMDMHQSDSTWISKNDSQLKALNKDIYLEEAIHIMSDWVNGNLKDMGYNLINQKNKNN